MNCLKYGLMTALFAVLSGACADDYLSLVVIQNQSLEEDCSVSADLETPSIGHGFLELAVARSYTLTPVVQSNLVNQNEDVNGDLIGLSGAVIELQAVDSDTSRAAVAALGDIRGRRAYFSGVVTPGGSRGLSFEIIDSNQVATLRGAIAAGTAIEILARVVVEGEVEGTNVASPPFIYPVTLCNGCGAGQINLGACSALPVGTVGIASGCFAGQDSFAVECCSGPGGEAVCPAIGTMAPPAP